MLKQRATAEIARWVEQTRRWVDPSAKTNLRYTADRSVDAVTLSLEDYRNAKVVRLD
jgi:hypothetical protein